jgi:hypothetical protein
MQAPQELANVTGLVLRNAEKASGCLEKMGDSQGDPVTPQSVNSLEYF